MIHPHCKLDFVSEKIGYGVFATKLIPKGTIVYVKDDLEIVIDKESYLLNDINYKNIIDTYSYRNEKGEYIVSWDIAKYVNHCCEPNTLSTAYGFEIAITDILPGDQITDEYGLLNIEQDIELSCNKCTCRGKVSPNDYKVHLKKWEKITVNAMNLLNKVDQPLWSFLDENTQVEINNFLDKKSKAKSLINTIFQH